ncbi:uncharacterized protein Z518_06034 [Rhinocladiella mackenziei CBS 650.93]|uniref:Major facilitator superfamily (MFS) profile domain-containing protein n=1 Tax=Rhinocladiella mackenziei CBS 650.93 TaxID=1442369 RepID=A0A0D2FSR1_9EURO|nr:uncharacterized protein Z518_06034 [Rhinocladiella mackenziei CBS 650.93]KIX05162.1 hypothetical protein Z518_06034 [Rhinocladiella mackenziei CBS 650.93]
MAKPMLLVCLTAAVNCASVGYDSAMMSSINILDAFTEKFDVDADLKGLLTAAQNIGAIAGGFIAGSVVDRLGRKGGILASSITILISCLLLTTANSRAQFFVGRSLVGLAKAFDIAAVPTYLVEMAPPHRRGLVAGFYWACWLLGSIIAAAVGYGSRSIEGTWSWRTICICMSGPALACILVLFFIPESPRWLVSKGREEEGLDVLAKYHGNGDRTHQLVVSQFREIKETIAYEQANRYETWKAWWNDFNTPPNRRRAFTLVTLGVFEQTVGSSIITFYTGSVLDLSGITGEKQQFAINLSQTCVAFASALCGIFLIDKVGRVKMLVAGSVFCAAVLACMAGLTAQQLDTQAGRNGIIAMLFLFQMGYSSTWTPLSFSYCAEVLNFTLRAKGMAFYNIFTSSSGFINQYVIPVGLANIKWRFYIIGVVWDIFMAIVIVFTYIETKGLTLEQIQKRFEGTPRSELGNILEVYHGEKPLQEFELDNSRGGTAGAFATAAEETKGKGTSAAVKSDAIETIATTTSIAP